MNQWIKWIDHFHTLAEVKFIIGGIVKFTIIERPHGKIVSAKWCQSQNLNNK